MSTLTKPASPKFSELPPIMQQFAQKPVASAQAGSVMFTVISSVQPTTLTKQCKLDSNGALSWSTAAQMMTGNAQQRTVSDAEGFAKLLQTLAPSQALAYGVADQPDIMMMSKAAYESAGRPDGVITRTKDRMQWPESAGVLMLDYDPRATSQPLTQAQLLAAIASVLPELDNSARVWWCSSSSMIYNGPDQLTGTRGQRVYILVKDARDIERAGKNLFKRLWLAGHGYMMITRAGTLLEKSIIDASVWQTNRLDFAAGASCIAPLEQRRPAPVAINGDLLDTVRALPDLTPEQQADFEAAIERAKIEAEPERQRVRQLYIDAEARNLLTRAGIKPLDDAVAQATATITRAVKDSVLAGDFIVTLDDGEAVAVGQMLDNPSQYHGRLTLDPLEPEYNGRKVVGRLYLIGGSSNLFSQAHGGKNYRLIRQPRKIEHIDGATTETAHRTLEYLRQLPDVFDMNGNLVLVQNGKARAQTLHSFGYYLGGVAQFWRAGRARDGQEYEKPLDPPMQMLNQILAIGDGRGLKPLEAVITAPVITKAGRVINRAGYDMETGLYLDMQTDPLPVPENVSAAHATQALSTLMEPFKGFSVATPLDNGVLLAAALTAIQRPVFKTAPAIGLDAPVQGTGKTYLAECLGMLATGENVPIYAHTRGRDDEEVRKRLTAVLMSDARVLLWDNILGDFDSASMASLLTSGEYADRILGKSESAIVKGRALIMLTGNNLTLAGDMPRRVLKCRLDAQIANPATRKFNSNPLEHIRANRPVLVQAGLTLIRAYLESPECKAGGAVKGESTASFEDWDYLVRQTVAWVAGGIGSLAYEDPANALKFAVATDPELEELNGLLEGVEALMGGEWFATRELINRINQPPFTSDNGVELRELLGEIAGRLDVTTKSLGRILSYRVDRIADNRKLEKRQRGNKTLFRVAKVDQ